MAMPINHEWVLAEWDRFLKVSERVKTGEMRGRPPRQHAVYRFAAADDEVRHQASVARAALRAVFPGERFLPRFSSFNLQMQELREIVHESIPLVQRSEEIAANLRDDNRGPAMAADSLHPWVWDASRPHWDSGNYRAAIHAAATNVNSRLRKKLGRRDASEGKLVREAFSLEPAEVDRPRLRLASRDDPEHFKSVQVGANQLGCGLFSAVRNPVAHLADADHDLEEQEALESLAAFSLFARWVDRATVELSDAPHASESAGG
jgi:uncharacterized protein (TIGR02391 family)